VLKVLASNALDAPLRELAPQFELGGERIALEYHSTNQIVALVRGGAAADVLIAGRAAIDELAGEGRIAAGGTFDLAASGIGVCVRKGAPRPDIGTVEAFKHALLAAKSVAHTSTGQSGSYFAGLIERLGIGEQVRAKAKVQAGGIVGELVARGEAELGIQQIAEMLAAPGVELVGPLPPAIQKTTMFTAGICAGAPRSEAARSFVAFLRAPAGQRAMQACGLEPARPS
jgi:molybdate transport system substrate-binding protein